MEYQIKRFDAQGHFIDARNCNSLATAQHLALECVAAQQDYTIYVSEPGTGWLALQSNVRVQPSERWAWVVQVEGEKSPRLVLGDEGEAMTFARYCRETTGAYVHTYRMRVHAYSPFHKDADGTWF